MKRKHKIVIATGVISLSMVTAMATGLINTGSLFAEDPTTLSATVFNGFQAGDKVILGGKEFVMLDPKNGNLLSMENAGEIVEWKDVENQRASWNSILKGTDDGINVINGDSSIVSYADLEIVKGCSGDSCSLIANIGNGSPFWTGTVGENQLDDGSFATDNNTRIVIDEAGEERKTVKYGSGEMGVDFKCSTVDKYADFFISGSSSENKVETVCEHQISAEMLCGGERVLYGM